MKYSLLLLFFLTTFQLFSQNRGEIRGVVTDDDGLPLHNATVSVFSDQDSAVIAYTLTSEKGKFQLFKLPLQKKQSIYITHVNGAAFSQQLDFANGELVNLDTIRLGGIHLEEIVVERQVPIRLNGDTLEYKASYFKTRPNANVEELLKLLPGLQVNLDGSILFEGKEVSTVRVNNKDFFSNDIKIATRNLDASLIDVVQVIRDKGESKREILDNSDLPVVINLKMKREFFKANFGKLYGGIATRDRYESGALINTFRDTLQVSFIGFANNINRSGFDYSELMEYGGLNRTENAGFSNYMASGLLNQISAGVNVNYDIEKKLKTNIMYNYQQRNYTNTSTNSSNSFYDDITESGESNNDAENDNFEHSLRTFFRYHIDTNSTVSYDASFQRRQALNGSKSASNRVRDAAIPVIQSENQRTSNNASFNFNHRLSYERKLRNKWLLSANHTLTTQNRNESSTEESLDRFFLFNDSLIDQTILINRNGALWKLDNKINLQVPLGKKTSIDFYTEHIYAREWQQEDLNARINAVDFQNRNDVANDKIFSSKSLYTGAVWNQRIGKNINATLGLKWLSLTNQYDFYDKRDNTGDEGSYLLPSIRFSFKGISTYYLREVVLPQFYNIVAINSDLYPTRTNFASPYFDNTTQDVLHMQYFKYFQKSKINLFLFARFTKNNNSIANASTYDLTNSTSTSGLYQASGTDEQYYSFTGSKTIINNKVWQLSYSTNLYSNISQRYSRVNGEENLSNTTWGRWQNNFSISYKTNFTITPTYELNMSSTRYQYPSDNFRNVSNNGYSFGTSVLLNDLHKFRLESSYTLKNQVGDVNGDRQNLHLINASVYYPLLAKGELKLSVFDLLNQNVSNYFGASGNVNYYNSTMTLRQYFLLGFVYKFLKTPGK